MNKKITFISTLLLVTIGCDVNDGGHSLLGPTDDNIVDEPEVRIDVYYFDEQPNLNLDDNGYYHLDIDMTNWQTLHRLTGFISDSATTSTVVNCRVEWESSHYWTLGDTLGYFIRRGLTDDLVYVNVDTSYVIGFSGMEVPTINPASYSNSDGEVNTMIAPVQTMVGDTMTIWYSWGGWYSYWKTDSLKIVLN
jgi:hypothetical protein